MIGGVGGSITKMRIIKCLNLGLEKGFEKN